MHLQIRFRRNGLYRTAVPFRRASALRSCKCPVLPQIFHSVFSFRSQAGSPDPVLQNLCIRRASAAYVLPLPHKSRGSYVPPATKILSSAGTDGSSSPISIRNTTDSILSEDHGKTVQFCSTHRRTTSLMSDGCRISPEAARFRHVSPMQLPAQIPQYDLSLSEAALPGSEPEDKHFLHRSL